MYKQKLIGNNQTRPIVILANVKYISKEIKKIGYKVDKNLYLKDKEMKLYFLDENSSKDLLQAIDIFFLQCQLKPTRYTMQDKFLTLLLILIYLYLIHLKIIHILISFS